MPLIRSNGHFTRTYIQERPTTWFCFGDNTKRVGMGGMAKEFRGEPNTIGIATKWSPSRGPLAYFSDINFAEVTSIIHGNFIFLYSRLKKGEPVIWSEGIGMGLSEMPTRCPLLWKYFQLQVDAAEKFGRYVLDHANRRSQANDNQKVKCRN